MPDGIAVRRPCDPSGAHFCPISATSTNRQQSAESWILSTSGSLHVHPYAAMHVHVYADNRLAALAATTPEMLQRTLAEPGSGLALVRPLPNQRYWMVHGEFQEPV